MISFMTRSQQLTPLIKRSRLPYRQTNYSPQMINFIVVPSGWIALSP